MRRFDLSMNASSLMDPRLDLSYLARRGGLLLPHAAPLDFCLLVTVSAPGTTTLYTDVESTFPVLNRLDAAHATAESEVSA